MSNKFYVYVNIHMTKALGTTIYSVKQGGKVVAHVKSFHGLYPQFKVSPSTIKKIRVSGHKIVGAFMIAFKPDSFRGVTVGGSVVGDGTLNLDYYGRRELEPYMREITFNPHKHDYPVYIATGLRAFGDNYYIEGGNNKVMVYD